jgi:multidrug transporter EmrE-like cation transporter
MALSFDRRVMRGNLEQHWPQVCRGGSNLKGVLMTAVAGNLVYIFAMLAAKSLPVSITYAIIVGTGIAGSALVGMYLFDEPRGLLKIACISLILIGIVGLKLMEKSS